MSLSLHSAPELTSGRIQPASPHRVRLFCRQKIKSANCGPGSSSATNASSPAPRACPVVRPRRSSTRPRRVRREGPVSRFRQIMREMHMNGIVPYQTTKVARPYDGTANLSWLESRRSIFLCSLLSFLPRQQRRSSRILFIPSRRSVSVSWHQPSRRSWPVADSHIGWRTTVESYVPSPSLQGELYHPSCPPFPPCHSERVRDSPADTWFLGDISRDLERCRMSRQHRQEVCPPSSPCHYKPNPRSERPTPPSSLSPPALFLSCPTLIHRLKWPVSSSITYQPTPPSPQRTSSPAPSSLPPPYLPPN